ncbi:hypothetical protein OKW34_000307 [Paraburkholderia youngii]
MLQKPCEKRSNHTHELKNEGASGALGSPQPRVER